MHLRQKIPLDTRFFLALVQGLGIEADGIVPEHPHAKIARAKIDTRIPIFRGKSFAIEFRYDRPIPSETNQPRTQKAGHLIKEIFRLARIHVHEQTDTIFVYLKSHEMATYLKNPANGLQDFFDLPNGHSLRVDEEYLKTRALTLRDAAGAIIPCAAESLLSRSLAMRHELRIFKVTE